MAHKIETSSKNVKPRINLNHNIQGYTRVYNGYTMGIQWVYNGYTRVYMGIQWVYSGYTRVYMGILEYTRGTWVY